jgi:hypothetical protein
MGDFLDEVDDEFEDETEDESEDQEDQLATDSEGEGDSEEAELEARAVAAAQADAILKEFHGDSDQPPTGPGTDEEMAAWGRWMEKSLGERQAEREAIEAVFAAEEAAAAAAAGEADDDLAEPVDFSRWDSASFAELVDRATGAIPAGAPRRAVDDGEWERGIALMEG